MATNAPSDTAVALIMIQKVIARIPFVLKSVSLGANVAKGLHVIDVRDNAF